MAINVSVLHQSLPTTVQVMKFLSRLSPRLAALHKADSKTSLQSPSDLELATAVLLLEVSLADSREQAEERQVIWKILQETFALDEQALTILLNQARENREAAASLHEFTHSINETLSREDRTAIIEKLWRVAFADHLSDKYEEYYIRKIAGLLHVGHQDYIKTKLQAQKKSNKAAGQ